MMQSLVGIVRTESEMQRALAGLRELRARADRVGIGGHREYNPGWHAALDLHSLLTAAEAITRCALERKESRGGHFRDDYPEKQAAYGTFNFIVRKGKDGVMELDRVPIPTMPAELQQIIEEMK
jgi:succinate dehydrogenase / fumarate reductase flavoprotein subunit